MGNGVGTTRSYDAATGLIQRIQSGVGESSGVQNLGYSFDSLGNLLARDELNQDVFELFGYDRLNRLTGGTVYDFDDLTRRESKTYRYDAVGNMVNKSDVGAADYVYGTGNAAGAGDAGPHAVVGAGGNTYAYDDNGNMISGAGRTLTWTSFNKPRTVVSSSTNTRFDYGPERARIRQVKVQGATTTTVKYVGMLFEQVGKTGAATRYVNYIFAGSERVAIYTTDNAPTPSPVLRYLHRDHLGSVDTITNESGVVVERLSYDAFGKRRTATGENAWRDAAIAVVAASTPRGFTDHEHLDAFTLVHMNGRVYDPVLGRFLSADPFIQFPESTQGLNRYTYAANNPLSFTYPSGYFIKRFFRWVGRTVKRVVKAIFRTPIGQAATTIAAGIACGPVGPACVAAASGAFAAINGGGPEDIFKAAGIAFLSAHAFTYVGHGIGLAENPSFLSVDHVVKTVAHGVVGGTASELSGGKFKHGFLAAGVAQLGAPMIGQMKGAEARYARVVAAVALGGTASQLGGGKFANGAIAGAFGRLFNDEIHLQASLRIPRWLGRLVFGPDYIGQGGTVGGAVSFPGFTSGQFDLGVFVEGHGGGEDYGTGRFSVGIGYGKGDVRGLTGIGTEFSFNAKVGGLAVSLDRNDAFKGMGAHVGTGYNVGGTGTITRSWSVRSLKDWLSNRYGR